MIVTANKRVETAKDVGLAISVLGSEQLQRQHIASLQDLSAAVPSLTYTPSQYGTPIYTMRGVGYYDTALAGYPTITTYLDQAPLPFQVLTTETLFDLERVEVLKGPQGTLFGNNATGGAINYIAAKPKADFGAGASLSYGRFNTVNSQGFVTGPISDTLLVRLAVNATRGDGWQKSATRPWDSNGAADTAAARLLLNWKPTDDLRFELNLNGWSDRTEPQQAQFVAYIPFLAGYAPRRPFVPNAVSDNQVADWSPDTPPRADNRLFQASLRADYDLSRSIVVTSLTDFISYHHDQTPDGDGLAAHRVDLTSATGSIRSFSEELRLANNAGPLLRWILGVNYSQDSVYELDVVNFGDSTASFSTPAIGPWVYSYYDSDQHMKNYAAFGNAEYVMDQFTFKAGARYTKADRTSTNCFFEPASAGLNGNPAPQQVFFADLATALTKTPTATPGFGQCLPINPSTLKPGRYFGNLDQDNLSWRTGLDWKPSETFLGYVNVAKGYKAGGFPTLSAASFTVFTPVTQESVLSYEAGVKTQLFDRRLSVDLATFYYDYNNKQERGKIPDPVFGELDALVNIPKSHIEGVELEARAAPVTGLSLQAAVTYLDARIDRYTGVNGAGTLGDYDHTAMPFTPRWVATLGGNYQFPLSDGVDAVFGGQVSYHGDSNASIGAPSAFDMPGYTLVDLQAGVSWNSGRYNFMLWGKNVTDKFYVTNTVFYIDGISRWTGTPSTYGATLSMKY